ncbi:MAG: DNA mismatch repair protein MutS [Bacillota bacterium]|nr:DNA mismatch repair protein MutS [Bacillota bacterium]MDW7729659.1 DNA mismatch repair protein MutS [Bacillota bacterium]
MNRTSPMMEQYKKIKEQHPDKLLMFQVGDFYELFFGDAELGAREMEIALTSRGIDNENPIPLAGVPIHAADTYLNKLLAKGFKVVICDQVENSSQATGLVRREITRILTPGTITDPEMLDEGRNNYLMVILRSQEEKYGLAALDISTGDFRVTEFKGDDSYDLILDEIRRLQPSEILCSSSDLEKSLRTTLNAFNSALIETLPVIPDIKETEELIKKHWNNNIWEALSLDSYPLAASAGAAALIYLELLQQLPPAVNHFHNIELYFSKKNMIIDSITNRNLELTQSLRTGGRQGSLLGLSDRCMTGMGRRLLKRWIDQPLLDKSQIEERFDAVEELVGKPIPRKNLRKKLDDIFDLERFCSRLTYQRINARDLVALKNTIRLIRPLKDILSELNAPKLKNINVNLPPFEDLALKIESALVSDPPMTIKEGGLFREGYHEEVDRLNKLSSDSGNLLLEYEQNERRRTGIKTLKVGYNRNFGYFMEITKTNLNYVPPDYNRKQTLVNAERFTTEYLQQMEEQVTGARDKLAQLEYKLFEELRNHVLSFAEDLLDAAYQVALLDVIQGLAETAENHHYCRPEFSENREMIIKQARHPVVEQLACERFVPNDLIMNNRHFLLLITGPNMAGKSTYIRSAALIAIMAQIGSFVPAESALMPLFDRVFARVGASDDLSSGHSTFMVEMQETAVILKEATIDSLVILDEIGRGTSTYDGMSIARGVIEYICNKVKAKTLFSTHYHELTRLEGELSGVRNYTMAVKEKGKEVIFLRQIVPGKADKSYGINVARLAGVPPEVLFRAEAYLFELELAASTAAEQQLSLLPMVSEPLSDHRFELELIEQIREIDLNRLTPLEAMQKLFELQNRLLADDNKLDIDKEGK